MAGLNAGWQMRQKWKKVPLIRIKKSSFYLVILISYSISKYTVFAWYVIVDVIGRSPQNHGCYQKRWSKESTNSLQCTVRLINICVHSNQMKNENNCNWCYKLVFADIVNWHHFEIMEHSLKSGTYIAVQAQDYAQCFRNYLLRSSWLPLLVNRYMNRDLFHPTTLQHFTRIIAQTWFTTYLLSPPVNFYHLSASYFSKNFKV